MIQQYLDKVTNGSTKINPNILTALIKLHFNLDTETAIKEFNTWYNRKIREIMKKNEE